MKTEKYYQRQIDTTYTPLAILIVWNALHHFRVMRTLRVLLLEIVLQ